MQQLLAWRALWSKGETTSYDYRVLFGYCKRCVAQGEQILTIWITGATQRNSKVSSLNFCRRRDLQLIF